ncbi:MAG: UDP-N-acetylglucosamine 2-epimerase [Candidatus Bathyarchaeia archaeon]
MPEEINRRLTDHCSRLLLAPTENCRANLLRENLPSEAVRLVGDTMYDALLEHLPRAERTSVVEQLGLQPDGYVVFTLHRPENVDSPERLAGFTRALRSRRSDGGLSASP